MMHSKTALLTLLVAASLLFAACSRAADAIDAALAQPGRSAADLERDSRDHPGELLHFFGVKPGMVVLDLFAGGGYYSALLGNVVGDQGRVYMHNNAAYLQFAAKALAERAATGLPANVTRLDAEIGALGIPKASVDLVLMVMSYHDLYYAADDWSVDPTTLFNEVNALLKPGGILAIVDHAAAPGSPATTAQTLHRIDESLARSDITARGFNFTGSLDVLRNSADDHTLSVFDPAIRGKTDRFVMRFVKAP
jgi:predicted methyltransferase